MRWSLERPLVRSSPSCQMTTLRSSLILWPYFGHRAQNRFQSAAQSRTARPLVNGTSSFFKPFARGETIANFLPALLARVCAQTQENGVSSPLPNVPFQYVLRTFFRKAVSPFSLPPTFHADSTTSAEDSTHPVPLVPIYCSFITVVVVHVVLQQQARCQGGSILHCARWLQSGDL